ncbi:hypothetical protein [Streptomyces noursei]|uniref:hypothetical protein n=1 Tax=Streptomyces noursei TaxID=1971 RepID=UPI001964744C|nr:hypothetical protein [Streptomyces noursei]QRX96144.1 hypothetical protein JNO44_39890 [Streptomyces noursei]
METTPTITSGQAEVPAGRASSPTDATNGPEEPVQPEGHGDGQERGVDALRAELKTVRAEAAKCRTEAREAAAALKAARIPEQFQAVADRATELETELHRERMARRYHLPDALAVRIAGADEDAGEADAETLAELFRSRGHGVGRGGLDPSVTPVPSDPESRPPASRACRKTAYGASPSPAGFEGRVRRAVREACRSDGAPHMADEGESMIGDGVSRRLRRGGEDPEECHGPDDDTGDAAH